MSDRTKLPAIPYSADPSTRALKETLEVGTGVRGDPLDRYVTFRDMGEGGFAIGERGRSAFIIGIDEPTGGGSGGSGIPGTPGGGIDIGDDDLTKPPRPVNVKARGVSMSVIGVSWSEPGYHNHARTEVFASFDDDWMAVAATFDSSQPVSPENDTAHYIGSSLGTLFLHTGMESTIPLVDRRYEVSSIELQADRTRIYLTLAPKDPEDPPIAPGDPDFVGLEIGDTLFLGSDDNWSNNGLSGEILSVGGGYIDVDTVMRTEGIPEAGAAAGAIRTQDDLDAALNPNPVYYWVRFVSTAGVVGDVQDGTVEGRVFIDPEKVMDVLIGRIRRTQLANDLLRPVETTEQSVVTRVGKNVNGVWTVAGFGIGLEPNEDGELISTFAVAADQFAIMGAGVDGRTVQRIWGADGRIHIVHDEPVTDWEVGKRIVLSVPEGEEDWKTVTRGAVMEITAVSANELICAIFEPEDATAFRKGDASSSFAEVDVSADGVGVYPETNVPFVVHTRGDEPVVGIRGTLVVDGMISAREAEIQELAATTVWSVNITNFGLLRSKTIVGEVIATPRNAGWAVRLNRPDFAPANQRVIEFGRFTKEGVPHTEDDLPYIDPDQPELGFRPESEWGEYPQLTETSSDTAFCVGHKTVRWTEQATYESLPDSTVSLYPDFGSLTGHPGYEIPEYIERAPVDLVSGGRGEQVIFPSAYADLSNIDDRDGLKLFFDMVWEYQTGQASEGWRDNTAWVAEHWSVIDEAGTANGNAWVSLSGFVLLSTVSAGISTQVQDGDVLVVVDRWGRAEPLLVKVASHRLRSSWDSSLSDATQYNNYHLGLILDGPADLWAAFDEARGGVAGSGDLTAGSSRAWEVDIARAPGWRSTDPALNHSDFPPPNVAGMVAPGNPVAPALVNSIDVRNPGTPDQELVLSLDHAPQVGENGFVTSNPDNWFLLLTHCNGYRYTSQPFKISHFENRAGYVVPYPESDWPHHSALDIDTPRDPWNTTIDSDLAVLLHLPAYTPFDMDWELYIDALLLDLAGDQGWIRLNNGGVPQPAGYITHEQPRAFGYIKGSMTVGGGSRIYTDPGGEGSHFVQMDHEFPLMVMDKNFLGPNYQNNLGDWDQWLYTEGLRATIRGNAFFWVQNNGQAGFNAPTEAIFVNDTPLEPPTGGSVIRVVGRLNDGSVTGIGRVLVQASFHQVVNRYMPHSRVGVVYRMFLVPADSTSDGITGDFTMHTPSQRNGMTTPDGKVINFTAGPDDEVSIIMIRSTIESDTHASGTFDSPGNRAFHEWHEARRGESRGGRVAYPVTSYYTDEEPGHRFIQGVAEVPAGEYKVLLTVTEVNGTDGSLIWGAISGNPDQARTSAVICYNLRTVTQQMSLDYSEVTPSLETTSGVSSNHRRWWENDEFDDDVVMPDMPVGATPDQDFEYELESTDDLAIARFISSHMEAPGGVVWQFRTWHYYDETTEEWVEMANQPKQIAENETANPDWGADVVYTFPDFGPYEVRYRQVYLGDLEDVYVQTVDVQPPVGEMPDQTFSWGTQHDSGADYTLTLITWDMEAPANTEILRETWYIRKEGEYNWDTIGTREADDPDYADGVMTHTIQGSPDYDGTYTVRLVMEFTRGEPAEYGDIITPGESSPQT